MKLGDIIKEYCFKQRISQRRFALNCDLTSGYVSMLIVNRNPKNGKPIIPTIETYKKLAKGMNMSLDDLFDILDNAPIRPSKKSEIEFTNPATISHHKIPLVGSVAGGEPIYDEEVDLFIEGPTKATCAVKLKGQSMEPLYKDGDIIYIKEQPDVNNGEVAVVIMDDSASLKRVYHIQGGLQLLSENPKYAPIIATAEEYDSIRILGVPCGYTRMYDKDIQIKLK